MKRWFYTKLAWTGIRKNKQLYYPYFIAAIAMVTVFYIFSFLVESKVVRTLPGRAFLPYIFQCGMRVVAIFSIPFLFYTNSSLVKKRKKELGLYNILGMNKKNIFLLLFWETLITYGIVVIGGILLGILLSKIAELGLVNIMNQAVNYHIYIEWKSVLISMLVFACIFFLILLNMLRQIQNNNPIELLHSDSVGERPPKGRLLLAAGSLVFLLTAYCVAASIEYMEEPFAFQKCFAAGVLITIGTFLLFICASVYLCKRLQNNKKYYYKTSHFVTVSSMSYRMKRNGASLATICVLVTVILVTLSFSVSFYTASMDIIKEHYPFDIGVTVEIPIKNMKDKNSLKEYTEYYRSEIENSMQNADANSIEDYSANMLAMMTNDRLDLRSDMRHTWFHPGSGLYPGWEEGNQKIVWLRVMSLEDYNRLCKTSFTLDKNEVLVASETIEYAKDVIVRYNGETAKVKKSVKEVPTITYARLYDDGFLDAHDCETMFVIVPDLYSFIGKAEGSAICSKKNYMNYQWEYGINMQKKDTSLQKLYHQIAKKMEKVSNATGNTKVSCYSQDAKGEKYYSLAGGLLFLASMVDILFIVVTALIMYYKQISEGYEDQKRFLIMRNIGMTTKEIKKSIYSQILTVFLLPLIVAGIHLIFTSNISYLLLKLAIFDNKPLFIKIMCISYLIFAGAYTCMYLLTSKSYFKIVNQSANE
ncbi:MAG: FtsX-like permease family protein [Lachnospiraceae bacterium]|nr:FtsX-like permease family protein [Lachnospiraceae bacterium]